MRQAVVAKLVEIIRQEKLSYEDFIEASSEARKVAQLKKKKTVTILKPIPNEKEIVRFINTIELKSQKHALMIRVLIYTGIRCRELTTLKIEDLDLTPGKETAYIHRKAGRDKTIVIPSVIAPMLRMYIEENGKNVYLFESSFHRQYTTRGIRKMVQKYRESAELSGVIHPHNFRHFILTFLGEAGFTDSQLQLVSGHDKRESLSIYIDKNPRAVRGLINETYKSLSI